MYVCADCTTWARFIRQVTTDPASVHIAPADAHGAILAWRKIVSAADMLAPVIDSPAAVHQSTLYMVVEKDAPNRKLIVMDLDHLDAAHTSIVVQADSSVVLIGVYAAQNWLYLSKRGVTFEL